MQDGRPFEHSVFKLSLFFPLSLVWKRLELKGVARGHVQCLLGCLDFPLLEGQVLSLVLSEVQVHEIVHDWRSRSGQLHI